jgi:hypothetical protein
MGGFLSLYDETDRIDLGGGYYVDIKRYLTDAEHDRAQRLLVDPRMESRVTGKDADDSEVRAVTTTINQGDYNHELLVAAIIGWNLTDRDGNPLPLPPYMPPGKSGNDKANTVRRESIRQLPAFATKKILKQILDNEKRSGDDQGSFPGEGESGTTET